MNRNSEGRFAQVPRANIQRAKFKRDYSNITTINEGDLVPIYVDEVLPGDTISINQNSLIRMATPLYPVMDNAYIDMYYFFVPNRLLWEHWENLMGQNDSTFWAETTEYSVPQTTAPTEGWANGTIADYMGIPTGISGISVNSMPFRAYARIWNEWFRDENLQQPYIQDMDDTTEQGSNVPSTGLDGPQKGGMPAKVGKYHDYFTSCLPAPQKGEAASIPIKLNGLAQVRAYQDSTPWGVETYNAGLRLTSIGGNTYNNTSPRTLAIKPNASNQRRGVLVDVKNNVYVSNETESQITPTNLVADLSKTLNATNIGTNVSINELRQAIALQHILEADARGGTRYIEILAHEFGVTSPDSRLQRSEYIGGTRIPININQVIQQSATSDVSPQGNTAAYSMTTSRDKMVSYSAVEHGYILGLAAVRVEHSYQQGLSRMWTRKGRFDFYHPMLANLSEMAVLNREIYAQGTGQDEEVFGYQEAWADYRYHPNIVTGEMRSNYAQTLDAWHYADEYNTLPMLSSSWIQEGQENIDRTLAVQSSNAHQFIANFYFDQTWTRPMPLYSVPGLERI